MELNVKSENRKFLAILGILAFGISLRYFDHTMTEYNTTLFAMSYKYGFISRGMLGTIYQGLDALLPFDLMTYQGVYYFTMVMTLVYYLVFFLFLKTCLEIVPEGQRSTMRYLSIFLSIFAFSTFVTEEMYGRLDLYLYTIMYLCLILLLKRRAEWLVLPLGIFCCLIHQGFVFTNAAPILVLLFYRCCKGEGKDRKRYLILLLTFFLSISVCFLYFEFASHSSGREIYDEVVAEAKSLSQDGESYNPSILSHEILGEDVFLDEWELHLENYREFPAFLVLGLPYLLIFYFFAKRVIKGESGWKRLPYLAFLIGVITILPEMILKVDYGRYMCITFVYYIAMTMVFLTMEDAPVTRAIEGSKSYLRDHLPIPGMVILYSIFFTPMFDVVICWAAYRLSAMVLGL